jgi:hypothetical protein
MRHLLMILAVFATPVLARASTLVVLSGDFGPFQEAFAGIKEVIPDAASVLLKDGKADTGGADTIIALGGQAAVASYPGMKTLVIAMVADPKIKPAGKHARVAMLGEASLIIAKIKALQPGVKALTAFDAGGAWSAYIDKLAAAGGAAGIEVTNQPVNKVEDLVPALRGLQGKAQALWLPPDPLLISSDKFKLQSEFCLANKIGLYAPAPAWPRPGRWRGWRPASRPSARPRPRPPRPGPRASVPRKRWTPWSIPAWPRPWA